MAVKYMVLSQMVVMCYTYNPNFMLERFTLGAHASTAIYSVL